MGSKMLKNVPNAERRGVEDGVSKVPVRGALGFVEEKIYGLIWLVRMLTKIFSSWRMTSNNSYTYICTYIEFHIYTF